MSQLNITAAAFSSTESASVSASLSSAAPTDLSEGAWHPLLVHCLLAVFLSAIIVLAVAGNVLVCVAVFTDRNLRKIGNLYIVSLSVADMTLACLVMTFALVNDLLDYWPMGRSFCDTWIAFDVMCSTASILNLCAISLDRYIHIKDPLRYGRWMSKRLVLGSIAAIWLMAALVSFLPISLGLHRSQDGVHPGQQTTERPQCALNLTPLYAVVSSLISFYMPCVVMLAIYSRLYLYARKHVRSIRALPRPHALAHTESEAQLNSRGARPRHSVSCGSSHVVSESKAATTLGIIVGVFLVCYLPFFCVNIVQSFCSACVPQLLFQTLTWFGYSNSSFNPLIYTIFNVEFREAFARILARCRQSCVHSCQLRHRSSCHAHRSRRSTCCSKLSVPAVNCQSAAPAPPAVTSPPVEHLAETSPTSEPPAVTSFPSQQPTASTDGPPSSQSHQKHATTDSPLHEEEMNERSSGKQEVSTGKQRRCGRRRGSSVVIIAVERNVSPSFSTPDFSRHLSSVLLSPTERSELPEQPSVLFRGKKSNWDDESSMLSDPTDERIKSIGRGSSV